MNIIALDKLPVGERGKVHAIKGEPAIRRRLLDMGIIRGTEIMVNKVAPLGDPIGILVKGYHLSLRKIEASVVQVERVNHPPHRHRYGKEDRRRGSNKKTP